MIQITGRKIILLAIVVATSIAARSIVSAQAPTSTLNNINTQTSAIDTAKASSATQETLSQNLESIIASYKNIEAAVSVIDLSTHSTYRAGLSETPFKAASTTKLLAAIAYLDQIEQGSVSLDTNIQGTSARQLITQMLTVSDNESWHIINAFLGDRQTEYATTVGMTDFTGEDANTATVSDMTTLLGKLHSGSLLSPEYRSFMLNLMQQADGTDLVKEALPSSAVISHKYGELWTNLHDTALVEYNGHTFAIAVFTKGLDEVDTKSAQVELIHSIAQTTEQYISSI